MHRKKTLIYIILLFLGCEPEEKKYDVYMAKTVKTL